MAGSEEHNKRQKSLDYVRKELSVNNEYWECDCQAQRKNFLENLAKTKTGRRMQAKATPIREGVVVISSTTTMDDLRKLADNLQQRFGVECFQIAIHRDEGHANSKTWKPNLHAHMVFDWMNHDTGKSIRLSRDDMADMQTIVAEALHMERGVSSDKKHLNAIQYKNKMAEEQLRMKRAAKKQLNDEIKELSVTKARKDATVKAAKNAFDSVKGLFGKSSKDKAIKSLQDENNSLKTQILKLKADAANREKQQNRQFEEMVSQRDRAEKAVSIIDSSVTALQSIPLVRQCIDIIRRYVRSINGSFDANERSLLASVMQDDPDAPKNLRNAAYQGCGVIGQWQYDSKWDKVERELENISNGVIEEEEKQQQWMGWRGWRR